MAGREMRVQKFPLISGGKIVPETQKPSLTRLRKSLFRLATRPHGPTVSDTPWRRKSSMYLKDTLASQAVHISEMYLIPVLP